ncbi:MAG: PEP-CTERM sorting domain-containing protein, partial [Pirellulaceae bacterium]
VLRLPDGYVSNAPLSGSAVYSNLSYATLGMQPFKVYGSWYLDGILGNDAKSITIQATPEPTSMAMWGIGAVAATWVRRRRRLAQPS